MKEYLIRLLNVLIALIIWVGLAVLFGGLHHVMWTLGRRKKNEVAKSLVNKYGYI